MGGLFFLSLSGCQQREAEPPDTGTIEANQVYLKNFGPPPYGKEGQGFARVGYLPLQKFPEKVRAIPLFLFSEHDQLRQILDRLTSDELILPPDSELYNPFPKDIEVTVKPLENGTLTLSLTTQQPWSSIDLGAAGRALTETASQFTDVERVRILLNREPLPQMPTEGYLHNPQQLAEGSLPTLVMMVGMWKKGAETLDEILIEFDRPIKVNNFQLYDKIGKTIEGEYFTSVFQMAVVVHPKDPERYQDGTVLRAEWDIVDALDRSNKGTSKLPLRRHER